MDLGTALRLCESDARLTGAEPFLVKPREPTKCGLSAAERKSLLLSLGQAYPSYADAKYNSLLLPLCGIEPVPSILVFGETVGTSSDVTERSCDILIRQADKLLAGRVHKIVQFGIRIPDSREQYELATSVTNERTSAARLNSIQQAKDAWQAKPAVKHTWLLVEWFKRCGPFGDDDNDQRQLGMAPRFYTETDDAMTWIPVQKVLSRFAQLPADLVDRNARRPAFYACKLPRSIHA